MAKFFNATNPLFQDMYLDLKLKGQYLKKVPDMSRQQVKVSGPNPKLSYIIQYYDMKVNLLKESERDYDTQILQVQMNNPMSVK